MGKYLILFLSLISLPLQAQDSTSRIKNEVDIGIGMGMDYGGIGIRGTYLPIDKLGLFASTGYNLNGLGFNAGAQWLFPKRRHAFFLTGMYGYNAVMILTEGIEDKATYYGISVGGGYQLHVGNKGNYWNWELLIPIRNSNFHDDYETLQSIGAKPGDFLPITFSVGFHLKLNHQRPD